jgi:methyl-accepting chemotaxis protein
MRQDAEQAARGLADQTRAIRDISSTTTSTAKQIRLIHAANREHSIVANDLLSRIKEVRKIAEQNAQHVGESAPPAPRSSNGGRRRAPRSNGSR